MIEKTFNKINGYQVEDTTARNEINNVRNELNNEVETLETNLNSINEKMNKGKKYIFIGDSYLEGWTPEGTIENWGVKVANILGLKVTQYQIVSYNGSGFTRVDTKTFTQMISELASDEEVTDVIVCGGYNDHSSSESAILSSMTSFKETCKSKFPNAKISIGHIGWSKDQSKVYNLHINIANYKKCTTKLGLRYLTNVEYALKKYFTDFSSDGFHPNEYGQTSLAEAISSAIISGQANIHLPFKNISFETLEGWTIQSNGNFASSVINGITSIYCANQIKITLGSNEIDMNCDDRDYEIGTITDGYVLGGGHSQLSLPVNCVIGYYGAYASVPGKLVIRNGKLYLRLFNTNQYNSASAFGTFTAVYLLQIQAVGTSIDTSLC